MIEPCATASCHSQGLVGGGLVRAWLLYGWESGVGIVVLPFNGARAYLKLQICVLAREGLRMRGTGGFKGAVIAKVKSL